MSGAIKICTVFLAAVALLWSLPAGGAGASSDLALEAGTAWPRLIDSGEYAGGWDAAAPYFQNAIKKRKWIDALKAARKPLGKTVSRKLFSQEQKNSIPGAPDGQYTVLIFNTSFERKRAGRELLALALGPDKRWRTVGYFIR